MAKWQFDPCQAEAHCDSERCAVTGAEMLQNCMLAEKERKQFPLFICLAFFFLPQDMMTQSLSSTKIIEHVCLLLSKEVSKMKNTLFHNNFKFNKIHNVFICLFI